MKGEPPHSRMGDHGRTISNQDRARGSQEGERFGVRPLAAEHQLLMASRNTSQVFGVSDSLCLASRHLPGDSGVTAGSAGEKICQELRAPSAGPDLELLISRPCAQENMDQMGLQHCCWGPGGFSFSKFHVVSEEGRVSPLSSISYLSVRHEDRMAPAPIPDCCPSFSPSLNTQLKPSRGAAVADVSTAVTEATLLNPSQQNAEGQSRYPG